MPHAGFLFCHHLMQYNTSCICYIICYFICYMFAHHRIPLYSIPRHYILLTVQLSKLYILECLSATYWPMKSTNDIQFFECETIYVPPRFIGQILCAISATGPIKCLIYDSWVRSFANQVTHCRLTSSVYWFNVGSDDGICPLICHAVICYIYCH